MAHKTPTALEYATHLLYRVPKTVEQVRIKLLEKWYSMDETMSAIKVLQQEKYLDDLQYAQMYLDDQVVNKGKPLFLTKKKLSQKWVSKGIVQQAIEQKFDDIQQWLKKWIIRHIQKMKEKGLTWFEILTKLGQKGYNYGRIKEVVKEEAKEEE